jgi:hypothetical protein
VGATTRLGMAAPALSTEARVCTCSHLLRVIASRETSSEAVEAVLFRLADGS